MVKKHTRSAPAQSALRSSGPAFDPAAAFGGFRMPQLDSGFRMPQLDAETMATAQRRNVEAMTAVCQLAFDCVQVSAQRQAQVFRDTAEEVLASFREVGRIESPQDQAASQMKANRVALERGMESLRSLAELVARANTEAFEIINKRAASCLQEMQDVVKPDVTAKK
ncbi:MAG: TIGR01841 family phasin [Alphaproteobacteria bacterium]